MDDETFFYGEEMKEAGFVDVIMEAGGDADKIQAMALASETFTACLKSSSERVTDEEFTQAAALLEIPKPTDEVNKKGVQKTEAEVFKANTSKVNAMNARLSLKKKGNHGKID